MAKKNREALPPNEQKRPNQPEQPSPDKKRPHRLTRGGAIISLTAVTLAAVGYIKHNMPDFYPGNDPLPACSDTELDDNVDLGHDQPAVDHMRTLSDFSFDSENSEDKAWERAFRDSGIDVTGYSEGAPALTATKVKISGGETDVLYSGVITYSANDREQGHPIILTIVNTEDLENLTPDNIGIITIGSNESEFHPNGGCTMPMPGSSGKHIVALTLAEKNENHAYRRTSRQMSLEVKNGVITTIAQDDLLEQPLTVVNYGSQDNERKIGKPIVASGFVVGYNDAAHTKTFLVATATSSSKEEAFADRTGQGSPLFVQNNPDNPYEFQLGGLVVEGSVASPSSQQLKHYNLDITDEEIEEYGLQLITVTDSAITKDLVTNPDVTEKAAQDEAQQSTASNTSRSNLYASDKPRPYWKEPENQAHSIPKYYVDPNATSDKQPARSNTAQL